MPHQCVRCNSFYDDGAIEILNGCGKCGGKLFFFIKKDRIEESQNAVANLSKDEKKEIESDVLEMVGAAGEDMQPVVLDFESIRVLKPGKYELDLVHLFKKEPLVFKLDEGKYVIDLPSTFKKK